MCERFITIQGFMISELGLTGNELLVYAVIYGYSQDGENEYFGSLNRLSELLRLDRRTTMRVLQRLCDAGLIRKRKATLNGVERSFYSATKTDDIMAIDRGGDICKKNEVGAKCPQGQNAPEVGAKCPPYNKVIIKEKRDINISLKEREKKEPEKAKKWVKPTVEEIKEYCRERENSIDAQFFYDYYESCGWLVGPNKKMKDWRGAVRTWEKRERDIKYNNHETRTSTRAERLADARKDIIAGLAETERAFAATAQTDRFHADDLFGGV